MEKRSAEIKSGSAIMRPRARLIGLIGDELISDEPVALVELVKNAYDADATRVKIRFDGNDPSNLERIIVEDDGIGMDIDTVLNAWFEPGTITKRTSVRSPGGRVYQGAKGIGRFAAARLAESLILESKTKSDKKGVFVLLDWGKFDDESYLDEISLDYELRSLVDFEHGTRLILEGLRKTWNIVFFRELHTRLLRLLSPFEDVSDFSIHLDIPGHPELSGPLEPPELILKPIYLFKGELSEDGYFNGKLQVNEKNIRDYKVEKLGRKDEKPLCGPFKIEIRAWDRDRKGLIPFSERYKISISEVRKILDWYSGVSIYRDGFRVHPYGEPGNDWLQLDIRSRLTPGERLANNQVVASIRISRKENPGLIDRSTREGLVHTAEFSSLKKWFIEVLTLLEAERYNLRPKKENEEATAPLFEAFDIHDTVKEASRKLGKDHPIARKLVDVEKKVKSGVERVQEVFSRLLMSAGLGHMIDIVIHEIGSPIGKINRQLVLLEKELADCIKRYPKANIPSMISSIKGWLEQIHSLRQRLDPQTPAKRGRATSFNVRDEIEDNFTLYEALIKKQGIKYEIIAPKKPIQVKMSRASVGQILANLVDNSIFWIVRHKGAGNGGQITVELKASKNGFRILFSDDGPGVKKEDEDKIFEPYFSRKPNGIGLGLYIARLVIEPYGRVFYKDDCTLSGACFEVVFERRVGL